MEQTPATQPENQLEEGQAGAETLEQQPNAATPKEKPGLQYLASRPVNIQSPEELQPIIERHQHWIASVLNPRAEVMEGRANISGSNISGFDLSGLDLRGVNFSRCVMHGANLQNANLNGANFNHADLQGADLRGSTVRRAIFDYADLRETELDGVDLQTASMSHAHLTPKIEAPAELTSAEGNPTEGSPSQSEESNNLSAITGSSPALDLSDAAPDSSI